MVIVSLSSAFRFYIYFNYICPDGNRARSSSQSAHNARGTDADPVRNVLPTSRFSFKRSQSLQPRSDVHSEHYGSDIEDRSPRSAALRHLNSNAPLKLENVDTIRSFVEHLQSLASLVGIPVQAPDTSVHSSNDPVNVIAASTPIKRTRHSTVTPQSRATAPPTSSPVRSDYDRHSSSPIKHTGLERGRAKSRPRASKAEPRKSSIRARSASSTSVSRTRRRVSFSTPEAIQIEDHAYEFFSSSEMDSDTGFGDNDVRHTNRHVLRNSHAVSPESSPRQRGVMRAQTPGPPGNRQLRSSSSQESFKYVNGSPSSRGYGQSQAKGTPGDGSSRPVNIERDRSIVKKLR